MLFLQELKKTIFSISYILIVIVLIAALHSQDVLNFKEARLGKGGVGGDDELLICGGGIVM